VCGKQGTVGRDLTKSRHLVVLSFSYLYYSNIFLSHKIVLILLYDSLITYIGFVEYTLFLSLH
jgi:hypothetical protein